MLLTFYYTDANVGTETQAKNNFFENNDAPQRRLGGLPGKGEACYHKTQVGLWPPSPLGVAKVLIHNPIGTQI